MLPQVAELPATAVPFILDGVHLIDDSSEIASTVLARQLAEVKLVSIDLPSQPGWIFLPNDYTGLTIPLDQLCVKACEVEAIREKLKATVVDFAYKLSHGGAA